MAVLDSRLGGGLADPFPSALSPGPRLPCRSRWEMQAHDSCILLDLKRPPAEPLVLGKDCSCRGQRRGGPDQDGVTLHPEFVGAQDQVGHLTIMWSPPVNESGSGPTPSPWSSSPVTQGSLLSQAAHCKA